jgi:hypothetical protein
MDQESSFALHLGCILGSHFHTLSHSTVLPSCSLNLRDTVSPQMVVTSGLWEMISLPFCLLRQAWIWIQVLTCLTGGAPLPSLVPVPHEVPLCIWGPHPGSLGGWVPSLDHAVYWCLVGFSQWSGECTLVTREVTNHHFHNPSKRTLRNVAGISRWDTGHWGSLAGSNILLCWHRLSLKDKEVSPYIPLQTGYRSKKQSSTHIWLHVTSLAISFPQCYVTFVSIL